MDAATSYAVRMNDLDDTIAAAIARLDADIADADARLNDLREKRRAADVFLEYVGQRNLAGTTQVVRPVSIGTPTRGAASIVESVVRKSNGQPLSVADVLGSAEVAHAGLDRTQVRNGMHYLSRKGLLMPTGQRGVWRWVGPQAAGPESEGDAGPADLLSSAPEGGEVTDAEAQHHDQGEGLLGRNLGRDHLGASVGTSY